MTFCAVLKVRDEFTNLADTRVSTRTEQIVLIRFSKNSHKKKLLNPK